MANLSTPLRLARSTSSRNASGSSLSRPNRHHTIAALHDPHTSPLEGELRSQQRKASSHPSAHEPPADPAPDVLSSWREDIDAQKPIKPLLHPTESPVLERDVLSSDNFLCSCVNSSSSAGFERYERLMGGVRRYLGDIDSRMGGGVAHEADGYVDNDRRAACELRAISDARNSLRDVSSPADVCVRQYVEDVKSGARVGKGVGGFALEGRTERPCSIGPELRAAGEASKALRTGEWVTGGGVSEEVQEESLTARPPSRRSHHSTSPQAPDPSEDGPFREDGLKSGSGLDAKNKHRDHDVDASHSPYRFLRDTRKWLLELANQQANASPYSHRLGGSVAFFTDTDKPEHKTAELATSRCAQPSQEANGRAQLPPGALLDTHDPVTPPLPTIQHRRANGHLDTTLMTLYETAWNTPKASLPTLRLGPTLSIRTCASNPPYATDIPVTMLSHFCGATTVQTLQAQFSVSDSELEIPDAVAEKTAVLRILRYMRRCCSHPQLRLQCELAIPPTVRDGVHMMQACKLFGLHADAARQECKLVQERLPCGPVCVEDVELIWQGYGGGIKRDGIGGRVAVLCCA